MGRRGVAVAHRAAARLRLRARGGGAVVRRVCPPVCPRSNAADPAHTARLHPPRAWRGRNGGGSVARALIRVPKHAATTGRFSFSTPPPLLPSPLLPSQNTMNLLLLGALSLPVGYLGYGYLSLFVPPK